MGPIGMLPFEMERQLLKLMAIPKSVLLLLLLFSGLPDGLFSNQKSQFG
jgi:hypothetical protein